MLDSEAKLLINFPNLKHNVEWIKSKTHSEFICPMVKANAYGAGAVQVTQALQKCGIKRFGVARLSEAQELREHQVTDQILLFNHFTESELDQVFELKVTPVVSAFEQLELLVRYTAKQNIKAYIHLEFDTGMNRLGFRESDIEKIKKTLSPNIIIEGLFTHFLEASNWPEENQTSSIQYKKFEQIANQFPESIPHIASSKALKGEKNKIKYGVRPGLLLYGIEGKDVGLKPVLTLTAPIISLRHVNEGETVSYGGLWKASKKSKIATIPIGYADGYSRRLTGKSYVLYGDQKVGVVGAICMDYMMVDVTDLKTPIEVGDELVVFGQSGTESEVSIESLAGMCDVITYEFITGLSHRLKRQVTGV